MDVGSFLIAFYEPRTDQIRYEIEILDGKKVARRSRPAGNLPWNT